MNVNFCHVKLISILVITNIQQKNVHYDLGYVAFFVPASDFLFLLLCR